MSATISNILSFKRLMNLKLITCSPQLVESFYLYHKYSLKGACRNFSDSLHMRHVPLNESLPTR